MTKRIVVVDDDPVVRLLLSECLSLHGYEVHTLGNGADGLNWIKENPADVLFVDLMMPDMTGLDVVKQIRGNPKFEKLPIVLLSANADSKFVKADPNAKPDRVLEKPWDMKLLLETLAEISPATK